MQFETAKAAAGQERPPTPCKARRQAKVAERRAGSGVAELEI